MSAPAPPAAGTDELRVVVFGARSAGKTRLLQELRQVAQSEPQLLGGRLQLESASPPTAKPAQQIASVHEGRFDPTDASALIGPFDLVVLDCDSSQAEQLLQDQKPLEKPPPRGTLAGEIRQADALVLTLDASVPEEELQARFEEFGQLLKTLQQRRGEWTEVTDLPVFLVLTKCDLLFKEGDTLSEWVERVDERKRQVGEQFRAFLDARPVDKPDDPEEKYPTPAFGHIRLRVSATALEQPLLRGLTGESPDPFSPTLLFRECLHEAGGYRRRCNKARQRLIGLVIAISGLVLLMIAGGLAVLSSYADSRLALLEDRVNDFRYFERGGPGERLRGLPEQLREKQQRLEEIANDGQFHRLSREAQQFIHGLLVEVKEYIPYLEKMLSEPALDRQPTEEALAQHAARLKDKGELALPYPEWAETSAGEIRQNRLDGILAIREAIREVRNWYLDSTELAGRLWTLGGYTNLADPGIDWASWAASAELQLDRQPPYREGDPVPGVKGVPVPYSSIYRFDRVVDARLSWRSAREQLSRLLDICTALGLAPATQARPAVLLLPGDFTLAGAAMRLMELRAAYPDYARTFNNQELPDAAVRAIRLKARQQYRLLLGSGRNEVLRQLQLAGKGPEETPARWQTVRSWLNEPQELAAWRELALTLLRLDDPRLPDPVTSLAEFLDVKQFALTPRQIQVEIPELRDYKPRAESRLLIQWRSGSQEATLSFDPAGPAQRDSTRRVVVYPFKLANEQRLTYRPGDRLWAELALSGTQGRLVWSQCRSQLYQFERLKNGARLQTQTTTDVEQGRLVDDVVLSLRPEDSVPGVPDLLPVVRLTE